MAACRGAATAAAAFSDWAPGTAGYAWAAAAAAATAAANACADGNAWQLRLRAAVYGNCCRQRQLCLPLLVPAEQAAQCSPVTAVQEHEHKQGSYEPLWQEVVEHDTHGHTQQKPGCEQQHKIQIDQRLLRRQPFCCM